MKTRTSLTAVGALLALSLISGASAFAQTQGTEDPMAESKAFLASPTSVAQATATAEAAAGGRGSSIEYQPGDGGAPDLIMVKSVTAAPPYCMTCSRRPKRLL